MTTPQGSPSRCKGCGEFNAVLPGDHHPDCPERQRIVEELRATGSIGLQPQRGQGSPSIRALVAHWRDLANAPTTQKG